MTKQHYGINIDDIISILLSASEAILDIYAQDDFDVKLKVDKSPLSLADLKSNELILTSLSALYPDIPIISEESGLMSFDIRKKWSYFWLLDPLDGTKEFINKTDEFCINLALVKDKLPVLGFIHLPVQNKTYLGIKGIGAFEISSDETKKIKVNSFNINKSGVNVVASRNHTDKSTEAIISRLKNPNITKLGSAFKFINIANGSADYYPRMINIMEWDTAAAQIIIEAAGGTLLDANTFKPLIYNKESMYNPPFIASGHQIS